MADPSAEQDERIVSMEAGRGTIYGNYTAPAVLGHNSWHIQSATADNEALCGKQFIGSLSRMTLHVSLLECPRCMALGGERAVSSPPDDQTATGSVPMADPSAAQAHIVVYGASDDCIETGGLVSEEFYASPRGGDVLTVMVDDATYASVRIEYDPDGTGEWRVQPTAPGSLVTVTRAPGEDTDGPRYDEHRCPRYSDKAVIDMQGIEARRVNLRTSPEGAGA